MHLYNKHIVVGSVALDKAFESRVDYNRVVNSIGEMHWGEYNGSSCESLFGSHMRRLDLQS